MGAPMATATLEDFMAGQSSALHPEPEDLMEMQTGQLVEHTHPSVSMDGVVVVETSDGEIMDVEKRIAFLSPILQLGCARIHRAPRSRSSTACP